MPLPKQFLEELPDKTDQALYYMLGNSDEYTPEALEAARVELRRRGLAIDGTISQQFQRNKVIIDLQMSGGLPKPTPKRGILFLVGGLLGGTLLVAGISFAFHDWSYLYNWLTGMAVLALAFGYFFLKKWLARGAIRLVQKDVQPNKKESHDT